MMPMYNVIEYSNNYVKISGNVWQRHKNDSNYNTANSKLFKFKARITERTSAAGNTKIIEFVVPLIYLRNVFRTL